MKRNTELVYQSSICNFKNTEAGYFLLYLLKKALNVRLIKTQLSHNIFEGGASFLRQQFNY